MNILDLKVLDTTELEIASIKSLDGLKDAKNLEVLVLDYNTCIEDISPIKDIEALQTISINSANISELPNMDKLINLKTLHMDNNSVCDLSSLANLSNLTNFSAIDQDIKLIKYIDDYSGEYTIDINNIIKDRDSSNFVIAENISGEYTYDKENNTITWDMDKTEIYRFEFRNKLTNADFTGKVVVKNIEDVIDNNLYIAMRDTLQNQ